jgi:hypothetical protein
MRLRRLSLIPAALISATSMAACYGYYPPSQSDLTSRAVQLSLTDSGAVILAPRLGNSIQTVDGRVVAETPSTLLLSVTQTQQRDGIEHTWKGESVEIPRVFVSSANERHFSRARTALFATVTTVALVAIKHAFGGAGGANAPGGTNPPPGPK